MNTTPVMIPNIRIITVSGRIASGSTTLGKQLAEVLHWKHLEGGEIFWETVRKRMGLDTKDTHLRPDQEDALFDAQLKRILQQDKNVILETKLAGFNAQGIADIFKILVVCENAEGVDQAEIRIDRLLNREKRSLAEAKEEVLHREQSDLNKWRKLYANGDANWVYYDKKYYDLVLNTFSSGKEENLRAALEALKVTV